MVTNTSTCRIDTDYLQDREFEIRKVLVVISPDRVKPAAPTQSPLLRRAVALARVTGCELELFHVVHDHSLSPARFIDPSEYARERNKRLGHEATLMAELVLSMNTVNINITHDTRWDAPRCEAILRKVEESQPDVVMKESRDHSYLMGIMTNNDWNLIRQSPAPLWFVNDTGSDLFEHIVTAIGGSEDSDAAVAPMDYDVFRVANKIASAYGAQITPVHAHHTPARLHQSQAARTRQRAIKAFAEYFAIDAERVQIQEGDPADVLTTTAASLEAGLIVMAARNLTRWQRLLQSVHAERVLANASCDVLFVKDPEGACVPEADGRRLSGKPAYDLEQAITDPSVTFGSPQALIDATQISIPMRQRILQLWEQDVLAQMIEEDEGGPVQPTKGALLAQIRRARQELQTDGEYDAEQTQQLAQ